MKIDNMFLKTVIMQRLFSEAEEQAQALNYYKQNQFGYMLTVMLNLFCNILMKRDCILLVRLKRM